MSNGSLLTAWFLAIRLGAIAAFAPPLGGSLVPVPVRVVIVLALAVALSGLAPADMGWPDRESFPPLGRLVAASASEAALGVTMALGLNAAAAMFTFGGRLLDVQIGFGIGQVFDPMTRQQLPVLTAAFNQAALVAFFVLDGHHALMRGFALSMELVPPGAVWDVGNALAPVMTLMAQLFSLGFAMVAPVVLCLMLAEVGLGMLARSLPQMNALVVGMPMKIAVGLFAMALWAASSGGAMQAAWDSAFAMWGALWR